MTSETVSKIIEDLWKQAARYHPPHVIASLKREALLGYLEAEGKIKCIGGWPFQVVEAEMVDDHHYRVELNSGRLPHWHWECVVQFKDADFQEPESMTFKVFDLGDDVSRWFRRMEKSLTMALKYGVDVGPVTSPTGTTTVERARSKRAQFAPDLERAHKREATSNVETISRSTNVGCFYCQSIYPAAEIVEYIRQDHTATCPKCGIDSVMGDAGEFPVTPEFLQRMHEAYCTRYEISE